MQWISSRFHKTHPVLRPMYGVALFMIITLAFHLVWKLTSGWVESWSGYIALTDFTTRQVYLSAAYINDLLLDTSITRMDAASKFRIESLGPDGHVFRHLLVDHSCSGLKQFYQAFFLFLIYPGSWKHKLWYIPTALLAMHLVNIFRIVALSFTMRYAMENWSFMHDWVLRPFFYVVLFGLWVLWNENFTYKRKRN